MKTSPINQYQILPGAVGIMAGYERALQEKKLDVICLSAHYEQVIGKYFDTTVAPQLYGGGIILRELLPATPENKHSELPSSDKNQRRFITTSHAGESDLLLGEKLVVIISFSLETPAAMIMTDPELVKSFHAYFDQLWSSAQ